jgi:peptide/nickel transport system substrate-binding protein
MAQTIDGERSYWSRRLSRRQIVRGAAVSGGFLATAALVGCGKSNSSKPATGSASGSSSAAIKHGAIVGGFSGFGQTLSPNSSALWASEYYALYDQLVRLEPGSNGQAPTLAPSLALSWDLAKPTQWVFKLRDGVQWSDGQPFTADDVKFTYDYIRDPANKSAIIGRASTVASVDVIDPKTVAINTTAIDPLLPRNSWFVHILPKHYVGDPKFGDTALGTKPVGTGAYIVDTYSQGSEIKLKKNPNSWRGTQGVDSIDMRIISEATTRVAAFQSGEVDMIDSVPYNNVQQVAAISHAKTISLPSTGYYGWDVEYFDAPWNDKRVRLALAQAVDYDAIIKTVFFGVPKSMQGQMLSRPTFGFNPNIQSYKYDPTAAKQMLSAAGVASGTKLQIEFKPTDSQGQQFAEACASYFKDVGFAPNLVPIDVNVWRDGLYGRRKRATLMVDSWSSSAALEASIAFQWMLSNNPGKFYNNASFDAAYNAAVSEPDDNKRTQDYQKAGQLLHDDPPGLWIVEQVGVMAYRDDKIAKINPMGSPPLYFDEIVLE